MKEWIRRQLPRPLWVLLRRCWTYFRRLGHWLRVLAEVGGDDPVEALKLYASALAGPVTALRGLDEWRYPHLLWNLRIRSGGNRFFCRRGLDDLWHALPSAHVEVRRVLAERLEPGGTFVDAGANIGGLTVVGARFVGPAGKTIAIEMMPETARLLRRHLAQNGLDWVEVVDEALSDAPGQEVVATMPAGMTGQASIARDDDAGGELERVRVRTTTLDIVTQDLPRIDVLKIDLEGAEGMAFAGGRETLARTQCVIFEDSNGSGTGAETRELVARAGFTLARLDDLNMIGVRSEER